MINFLNNKINKLNIEINKEKEMKFIRFYQLLIEWNGKMNLTGITDFEEVVEKHFVDSLSIVKVTDLKKINNLVDIGTGAGFPGIPIKIMFPHVKVTLLDSLNKRIQFLNTVIEELGLHEIETLHGRAEDFAKKKEYREQYDLCVSRAVANLSTLSEYCIPFVREGGAFISYKAGDSKKEIEESRKAVKILGGKIQSVHEFQLPETEINRTLVTILKEYPTAKKYPRKAGIPTKEPIK